MKIKTKKAASKRFRTNASGKFKFKHAFMRHNLSKRTKGVKRKLRIGTYVGSANDSALRSLLPNSL